MKSRNYYDVYQGRKVILKHATRTELREKLGITNPLNYVDNKYKAFGLYSVYVCDKDIKLSAEQEKKYQKVRTRFTRKSFLEWEEMNKKYGTAH